MKELIIKYLNGRANKAEQASLLQWLRKKENRKIFNSHKLDWKKGLENQQLPEGSEKSWSSIQDHLLQISYNGGQGTRKINVFFRIAAIFFFVVSLGSAVYFMTNQSGAASEFFTSVVAENGQISKVVLPDSTVVWLNSGSEIKYSNLFSSQNRDIKLSGEAYFRVTKNEELPLIVNSGELLVKVLGTKFNVNAYPTSEKIEVVLETGKVELLNSRVESFQYELKPGEKGSFNKMNRKLLVNQVNTSKFTSWKDGMINIYNQPLEELVKRLEVRYNQKFKYTEEIKLYHFTFTIKNETLDEIIKIMETIAPVKAVQKEDIIEFEADGSRKRVVGG